MGKLTFTAAASLVVLASTGASAGPSFTADAVQTQPGQPTEAGRVFFADQGMRFEFQRDGRSVVQIIMPRTGLMRMLYPQDKIYAEVQGPATPDFATRPETPCPPPEAAKCERIGVDTIEGLSLETWRVTPVPSKTGAAAAQPGAPFQVWWDKQRHIPIREKHADGSSAQTSLRGKMSFQGRSVEQWETTFVGSDGKTRRAARLHDIELDVDVREEYPSGATRELRNIRLAPPDPAWFTVPADFRRVDTGTPGRSGGASGGGGPVTDPVGRR